METGKITVATDNTVSGLASACPLKPSHAPSETVEHNVKADTIGIDSPGDTSQRCEPAPGVFYLDGFKPKVDPERPLCLAEQALALQSKGLTGEFEEILFQLSKISLYHLAPYRSLFTDTDGCFLEETGISDLVAAANFDSHVQSILLRYIGTIEIRLRTVLSYHLAIERGIFAHVDQATFINMNRMRDTVRRYRAERDRRIKLGDVGARDYMKRYGELPVWAAVETMSLGTLSMIFQNLNYNSLRKKICTSFGIPPKVMQGWLRTLSFARNECAHFGNLYGRRLVKESARVEKFGPYDNRSVFHICAIVQNLLSTGIREYALSFPQDLDRAIHAFSIDASDLGFPTRWKDLMLDLVPAGASSGNPTSANKQFRAPEAKQKPII